VSFAGVAETHSAAVFFFGDRAFKVKKPVDLGFLDFRDRAVREAVCHREVELNRRLAPDIYLGVSDLVGPDGSVCDHAVTMRRLPSDRRLSTLVRRGEDVEDDVRAIAHTVAAFHLGAEHSEAADRAAGLEATRRRWVDNTRLLIDFTARLFTDDLVGSVHGLAMRYLDGRGPLFAERVTAGRACDGHGDLLADDIFCLDDGPRILDCIEFDESLRVGDPLADIAFLAMDLHHLGRPDLAALLLDVYRELTADVWPPSLARHQMAYRSQVRAKVTAIRAEQGDPRALEEARSSLLLAEDLLEAARVRLILVGGLPGTGKSTIAEGIGSALDATVISSDVVRKERAGLPATRPHREEFRAGIYDDASRAATYDTLLERAAVGLAHGETVVLDASWIDARRRGAARRLARLAFADLVELRCTCPLELASRRLEQRLPGSCASDATPAVAEAMAPLDEPWPEATPVDTATEVDRSLESALDVASLSGRSGPPPPDSRRGARPAR
jgi:aminoglycoside phosphotransferase family enzyme/predicted kinase